MFTGGLGSEAGRIHSSRFIPPGCQRSVGKEQNGFRPRLVTSRWSGVGEDRKAVRAAMRAARLRNDLQSRP